MKQTVIYVHGKGGNAQEATHYAPLFPESEVLGFDYRAQTPWEAALEFPAFFKAHRKGDSRLLLIANSIGAYFSMLAFAGATIEKALFVSPIVDMERLICDMMQWAKVTPEQLCEKGEITTEFGQTLSWRYLCWVRQHPLDGWQIPTAILYAGQDTMTSRDTVTTFAQKHHAELTVYEPGEHWFHTPAQLDAMQTWERAHR